MAPSPLALLAPLLLPFSAVCFPFEFDASSTNPVSDPAATYVVGEKARFSVLTPHVIRLELSETGEFEDRGSLAFPNRLTHVPDHKASTDDHGIFTLTTDAIVLSFDTNAEGFDSDSLTITSNDDASAFQSWAFGDDNVDQLPGTIRTLDQTGPISLYCDDIKDIDPPQGEGYHCTQALYSSSGHAVAVDDAETPRVDEETGWWNNGEEVNSRSSVDTYVFAHGLDFKQALKDYRLIGSATPIPPRSSLGIWFTRWINYNQANVDEIVMEYAERSLPLDIFVLDMNWHKKNSWTGYT